MPIKDVLRYGLYYGLVYVGVLALIFVGSTVLASFYKFRSSGASIGALIAAAMFTYIRFLKNKVRLPTSREYWSLVSIGSIVVLVVDFALGALVVHSTQQAGIDGFAVLFLVGVPLLTGVLGNMLFFRRSGFGKRSLESIKVKQSRLGPPAPAPSNKMTFRDVGRFLVCFFGVLIPLYAVTRYASITADFSGEDWLPLAVTFVTAVCTLAFIVWQLGRRPTLMEYGLLVLASVVSATVFEIVSETAIYYYRFAQMPSLSSALTYMSKSATIFAVIFAIAYSRPVAWLVRPHGRST